MKYIKNFTFVLAATLLFMACETQMVDKLDDFNLEQGGYMRTVTPLTNVFSLSRANMAGTKMEAVLEAVTPDKGALFSSYDLSIRFIDTTPGNGDKTTTVRPLRSIPASTYSKDATTGYPRHTLIITGTEALTASGLTAADISTGDRFEVTAVMRLTNGKAFTASNTGVNITGGAFYSSPFFYRLNVVN